MVRIRVQYLLGPKGAWGQTLIIDLWIFHSHKSRFDPFPLPPVRFNLSHTDGLAVCAVVLKHDIGVDVEHRQRRVVSENIARRFFSPSEVREFESLPERMQQDRFFQYWTLKESYIKARGMGLSIPLEKFSFHLLKNKPIRISFDP